MLRLFTLHNGRHRVYLATNELAMSEELASELYRGHWGIEVFFRSIKQSCQRSKLRCGTPENVHSELHLTLLGIWSAISPEKETQKMRSPTSNKQPHFTSNWPENLKHEIVTRVGCHPKTESSACQTRATQIWAFASPMETDFTSAAALPGSIESASVSFRM